MCRPLAIWRPPWAVCSWGGWRVIWSAAGRRPIRDESGPGGPRLEPEVLRRSTTGYLVIDQLGRPLLSNARASELGVLHAGIVDPQIVAAAARTAVSGEPIDVELHPVEPDSVADGDPDLTDRRAGRGAVHRRRPDPGFGHRRIGGPADGGRPPGFRGQRLARAQDTGRSHGPVGRGHGRRGGRPGGRPSVRREAAVRVGPARRAGERADRAVPAAGRRCAARPRCGRDRCGGAGDDRQGGDGGRERRDRRHLGRAVGTAGPR